MKTHSIPLLFLMAYWSRARNAITLTILAFLSLPSIAQTAITPNLNQASLTNLVHYGIGDGLPSSEVYAFAFDQQGFLWLATDNGLCKFDGESFKVFTKKDGLPENVILELKTDPSGNIWGLTLRKTIFRINAKSETFYNFDYQKRLKDVVDIRKIYDWRIGRNGELFLSTWYSSKLVKPTDHKNARFFEVGQDYYKEIMLGSDEAFQFLLLRNSAGSILGFNRNSPASKKINYRNEDGNLIGIHAGIQFEDYVNHFDFYRFSNLCVNDSLYFISLNKHLLLVNFNSGETLKHHKFSSIITNFTLIKNELWVGFDHKGGLVKIGTPLGAQSQHLKILDDYTVTQIYPDSSGGVWIGTRENGVLYKPPSRFVALNPPNMKGRTIDFLRGIKNRIFLVSGEVYGLELKYSKPSWYYSTVHKSTIPMTDFSCYDGSCFANLLPPEYAQRINSDGSILIIKGFLGQKLEPITKEKIVRYSNLACCFSDLAKTHPHQTTNYKFNTRVSDVHPLSDSSFLLATVKGVYLQVNEIRKPTLRRAISDKIRVNAIFSDSTGKIWCATNSEGLIVTGDTSGQESVHFNSQRGLRSNNITSIVVSNGLGWAGTKNGLYSIKSDFQHSEITHFGKEDGLPSEEILQLGVYNNSWLIVSTMNGLCALKLDDAKPVKKTFDLFNLGFRVNDEPTSTAEGNSLSNKKNNIQISFGGKHYSNKAPLYWHRNVTKDSQWISTQDNKLYFNNLEPGNYHIQVSSAPRFIPQKSLEYRFQIQKPFAQTIWFAILLAVGVSVVGYVIVKTILARAKLNNKLLISQQTGMISQMNPHFIFNTLNSIQYYLTEKGAEKSYEYISNFSRLIRRVLDSSVTGEIRLNNEIQSLKEYLDLEILRFEDKFTVHFEIDPTIDQMASSIVIPSMIIQPFLENAIVHGLSPLIEAGKLELSMQQWDNDLVVSIKDNGIGRAEALKRRKDHTPNFQKKSIAMSNTTHRIELLNKVRKANIRLKLHDVEPHGTLVEIRIPL